MTSVHVQGQDGRAEREPRGTERDQQQDQAQAHNVLTFGPMPFGWLSVPLTRERAAAIVRFEARHGVKIADVITDFMDDQVFALSEGQVPCVSVCRSESPAPPKSPDENVSSPTKLSADGISDPSPRSYGPIKPPPPSPSSATAASEPPNDGSPASSILHTPSSKPQCTGYSCGNE